MLSGFKATNRNRKRDIRDGTERLQIDFRAETESECALLARVRRELAAAIFGTPPKTVTNITLEFDQR